jgi:hypothetical protein
VLKAHEESVIDTFSHITFVYWHARL